MSKKKKKNQVKVSFNLKNLYEIFFKSIQSEGKVRKTEINNERNVNFFFKVVPLVFNECVPVRFPLDDEPLFLIQG